MVMGQRRLIERYWFNFQIQNTFIYFNCQIRSSWNWKTLSWGHFFSGIGQKRLWFCFCPESLMRNEDHFWQDNSKLTNNFHHFILKMNILLYEVIILFSYNIMMQAKGCLQKKNAEKETLVHMGERGVKKILFFWFIKKGKYSYGGRG